MRYVRGVSSGYGVEVGTFNITKTRRLFYLTEDWKAHPAKGGVA